MCPPPGVAAGWPARWRWPGGTHRPGAIVTWAKALVHEMPCTLAALEGGVLSEWRATLVVRESACLDVEDRRVLDAELCGDVSRLDGMGDARLAAEAKAIAYRLDPRAVLDRAARAETERTVTIRPAPDTMTYVTALLPVAQGVSVYAALKREADLCPDGRSRGQVMADTMVERVTGRTTAAPMPIAVNLVLSDETLAGGSTPAVITDYGPVPAEIARGMLEHALTDPDCAATLRRLYASPATGALVSMESRSRLFPRGWPSSSGCGTSAAARPTATRRSGTPITSPRMPRAGEPRPAMVRGCARRATTPRRPTAGR